MFQAVHLTSRPSFRFSAPLALYGLYRIRYVARYLFNASVLRMVVVRRNGQSMTSRHSATPVETTPPPRKRCPPQSTEHDRGVAGRRQPSSHSGEGARDDFAWKPADDDVIGHLALQMKTLQETVQLMLTNAKGERQAAVVVCCVSIIIIILARLIAIRSHEVRWRSENVASVVFWLHFGSVTRYCLGD